MAHTLDKKDLTILNMLISEGRATYADIAKELGVKSPSVIDRIRRLENSGVIKRYTAVIDYSKLGYEMIAYIAIHISPGSSVDEVSKNIYNLPSACVVELYFIVGQYSFMAKIVSRNTKHMRIVLDEVRSVPNVDSTTTMVALDQLIDRVKTLSLKDIENIRL